MTERGLESYRARLLNPRSLRKRTDQSQKQPCFFCGSNVKPNKPRWVSPLFNAHLCAHCRGAYNKILHYAASDSKFDEIIFGLLRDSVTDTKPWHRLAWKVAHALRKEARKAERAQVFHHSNPVIGRGVSIRSQSVVRPVTDGISGTRLRT